MCLEPRKKRNFTVLPRKGERFGVLCCFFGNRNCFAGHFLLRFGEVITKVVEQILKKQKGPFEFVEVDFDYKKQ